jgi:poly-gamma-glutamate capsule biosynthesis protein CapA/YwtB (metallophosphatase superfamily)
VRAARRYLSADFVVVSVHWGIEYQYHPHAGQKHLADALVKNGADVVLGHHPHVVQDIRRQGSSLVVFSMGNFMFDNPGTDRRQSLIVRLSLEGWGPLRHVGAVELVPVIIDKKTHAPRLARGREGKVWRKRLPSLVGPDIAIAGPPPDDVAEPGKQP